MSAAEALVDFNVIDEATSMPPLTLTPPHDPSPSPNPKPNPKPNPPLALFPTQAQTSPSPEP